MKTYPHLGDIVNLHNDGFQDMEIIKEDGGFSFQSTTATGHSPPHASIADLMDHHRALGYRMTFLDLRQHIPAWRDFETKSKEIMRVIRD